MDMSRSGRCSSAALTLLVVLSMAVAKHASAQEQCTSHTITEQWLKAHGLPIDLITAREYPEQRVSRGGGTSTIPVVVHVVYNTAAENVTNSVINTIISTLNADYQALNADYDQVRAPFASVRADVQIEFCLATLDPDGDPSTGITRTPTTETWFDPDTETNDMKSALLGIAPWDPLLYLNIWICDISSGATGGLVTTGYAYLPVGGVVGSEIDGLVLDYSYGTGSTDRTATHEVGHYLGLLHPWGDGGCGVGDGISDTPNTDSPTFSCANTTLMKCDELTQYENFMDYSNCTMMFTVEQSTIMNNVLSGARSALTTSPGCPGNGSGTPCIPTAAVGPAEGDYIDGVVLGTIDNTGTGSISGPTYVDHSATWSTSLLRGASYTIEITGGTYSGDHYAAWIDFDGNGNFSTSEKLGEFTTSSEWETQDIDFTVPSDAILGTTILRVRGVYHNTTEPSPTDPCFDYAYGETEDYGINIELSTSVLQIANGSLEIKRFQDRVEVGWPFTGTDQQLTVLDLTGRTILAMTPHGSSATIPLHGLAAGTYQLIVMADGRKWTSRLFVNK